jgi:hypothetical protein
MIPAPPLVTEVPTEAEAWAKKKREFWRDRPYRCVRCNRSGVRGDKDRWLVVHHLGYWFPKGYEPLWALVALCQRCHRHVHVIHDYGYRHLRCLRRKRKGKPMRCDCKRRPDRLPYTQLAPVTNTYVRFGRMIPWRWMFSWQPDLPPWQPTKEHP